jgi:D-glycero-D-manno-heptose 1,7-bisphosphate phosphatase
MTRKKALFLDRDGNLIRDGHHTCEPDQISLITGVKEALYACMQADYLLFILTNQSGIGRGIFTWEQYQACHARMLELLELPKPGFVDVCAAPEHPDQPSLYRKPSPRFILESIDRHHLDPAACWMIGDRRTDWQAGLNAGIRSCAVRSGAPFKEGDEAYARENGVEVHVDFPSFVRQTLLL